MSLKVQFGCGGNLLPDFKNHDAEVDIRKPLPYGNESVDFVLAEHVSEHVTGPECLRFFDEVYRILKPGGIFRVCVPAILPVMTNEQARDLIVNHGHLIMFNTGILSQMLRVAGFPLPKMRRTRRNEVTDGHWKVIGIERDEFETIRYEATK